jgi:hypothetical protein
MLKSPVMSNVSPPVVQTLSYAHTQNEINNDNNNNFIFKYKYLTIEIRRMWNVKTRVTPVIIGATGTISKSFRKYVSTIPGSHDVSGLQKTAILGTAHILRKVLM